MVKNQTAHNDAGFHARKRVNKIAGPPMDPHVQSGRPLSKIQSRDSLDSRSQKPAQPSIPGPEFNHACVRFPSVVPDHSRNPSGAAEKPVQPPEIAPAPQRIRMPGIQRVEDLRSDSAREAHCFQALYQGSRSLCVPSTTRIPALFRPFSGCDLSR